MRDKSQEAETGMNICKSGGVAIGAIGKNKDLGIYLGLQLGLLLWVCGISMAK